MTLALSTLTRQASSRASWAASSPVPGASTNRPPLARGLAVEAHRQHPLAPGLPFLERRLDRVALQLARGRQHLLRGCRADAGDGGLPGCRRNGASRCRSGRSGLRGRHGGIGRGQGGLGDGIGLRNGWRLGRAGSGLRHFRRRGTGLGDEDRQNQGGRCRVLPGTLPGAAGDPAELGAATRFGTRLRTAVQLLRGAAFPARHLMPGPGDGEGRGSEQASSAAGGRRPRSAQGWSRPGAGGWSGRGRHRPTARSASGPGARSRVLR
jgi:hypothetical protein